MNGWILKALHPNIYGNHDFKFVRNYYNTYPMYEVVNGASFVKIKMRLYKCSKCGQEISMSSQKPRTIEPAIMWYDDCDEAVMDKALE